jgi:Dimethlysulfonioproprionate lyase
LARHPGLAFGLLLLGPETLYPAHSHPASEIYIPLGRAEWMRGDEPFMAREPGAVIPHRPNLVHATRSGAEPLAALYLWAGDLATHARIVGDTG